MFNAIKAPLVPTVILIGEIILAGKSPGWLVGLLIGFTTFWLAASLLTNRALTRKFPWLAEWLPFLPEGEAQLKRRENLMGKYIKDRQFRIADIADSSNRIQDKTFDGCHIYGPAIISPHGIGHLDRCKFDIPNPTDLIWELSEEQMLKRKAIGVIVVLRSSFTRCHFHGVGFIGGPIEAEDWRKSIEATLNPTKPTPGK